MSEPRPLNEQEQADLVAYLDGELGGEAARKVEARVAQDPNVRAEADALKRTWDLLDFLPKPEPSPDFTHRTLERLEPVRQADLRRPRRFWRRAFLGGGWAAALVLAALGGYAGFNRLAPREPGDRELVRDLGVIESKRLLEPVEDLEELEQLARLFGDGGPGS
jgi:anti-sigma factor RsiW